MTHGVGTVFVGPGVERGEIQVMDLFSVVDSVVKFDGVGASTVERVSGFESEDQVKGLDQAPQVLVVLLELFPFALPHDHDAVASSQETLFFEFGGFVDVAHGLITHFVTCAVAVGVTLGTPVPEATVKFVHGTGDFVVPIHEEGFVSA